MTEQVLRLFVSSPGDVPDERRRIDLVVNRLNTEFEGRVRIATIRWETSYYSGHDTFQPQIPEAADCDVVVAIFRARLGTPLPANFPRLPSGEPYPSGTAYEVLTAIEARKAGKALPDVYVFRYQRAPAPEMDAPDRAAIEQEWQRLKTFFETWFRNTSDGYLAAFQNYLSTDDFAEKVEDCLRQWLARRGYVPQGAVWDRVLQGSPFPGLAAFDADRRTIFFGRDMAIARALDRLRQASATFLLIIGASGSGKSSLLRAGLLPRLTAPGTMPEIDLWRMALVTPGQDLFLSLAESLFAEVALGPELRQGAFATKELLARQLATHPDMAVAPLREALGKAAEQRRLEASFEAPRPARLALAIDQAERLFLESDAATREAFAALLAALVARKLATVVMTLRSDAYAQFQSIDALVSLREAGATFDLVPPTAVELEEMVTRPVAACDPPLAFEQRDGRSLASLLVAETKGGDALPLLQMTLSRLYAAEAGRGDGILRYADYHGMDEAVTQTANEALATLDQAARGALPALVTGLVHDVGTDPATNALVPIVVALDRRSFEAENAARKALIDAFVDKRLLTTEGDGVFQTVRPVHEALLRIWPEAQTIVAEMSSLIRVRLTLEPMVRAWLEASDAAKPGYLELSPALLDGAAQLLARFGTDVPKLMRAFIEQAAALDAAKRDKERQEQERRIQDAVALAAANRRTAQGTGAGLVAALVLAALAGWQWHNATVERAAAQRSLALATQTANGLVFDLADKFRDVVGVPAATIKAILDQARNLQDQLLQSGQTSPALRQSQAAALDETAETLLDLGDTQGALAAAQQAQAIHKALAAADNTNEQLEQDVGLDAGVIGDVLDAQGDFGGALAAYRENQAIDKSLAAADKSNAFWQQDALAATTDIGVVLNQEGNFGGALSAYRDALATTKALASADENNVQWQEDMSADAADIGTELKHQGDLAGALSAYREAQSIDTGLAAVEKTNAKWQEDVSADTSDIGDMLRAQGDLGGALSAYRDALAIDEALAAADKTNTQWQKDVSADTGEIGGVLKDEGDLGGALSAYRDAEAIDKPLAAADKTNRQWQKDVWADSTDIGDVLEAQGDFAGALSAYRDAQAIIKAFAAADETNTEWQQDLSNVSLNIGVMLAEQGDLSGALSAFRGAQVIDMALAATDETNTQWQKNVKVDSSMIDAVLKAQGELGQQKHDN